MNRASELPDAVVLVEGASDQRALQTLARRLELDLEGQGIRLESMGGVTNVGHFFELWGPRGHGVELAGLCDAAEVCHFHLALEEAGFGADLTGAELESLGFFVCDADLEAELIRALGVEGVLEVAEQQRELRSFRTFQKQPAWQGRSEESQLRRWLASTARRKLRYAELLVEAMELERAPEPLVQLLSHIAKSDQRGG